MSNSPSSDKEKERSLEDIISEISKAPTIINEESKFVVITYWWGRGNSNPNIARPCLYYYEKIVDHLIEYGIDYFKSIYRKQTIPIKDADGNIQKDSNGNVIYSNFYPDVSDTDEVLSSYAQVIKGFTSFQNFTKKRAKQYIDSIYVDLGFLDHKSPDIFDRTKAKLQEMKSEGTSPANYILFEQSSSYDELLQKVTTVISDACVSMLEIRAVGEKMIELFRVRNLVIDARNKSIDNKDLDDDDYADVLQTIGPIVIEASKQKQELTSDIKKAFKQSRADFQVNNVSYTQKTVYEALNDQLRFRSDMKFEDMIARWEESCKNANCNYLQIEYDYFRQTKQYQRAINAKPLFIQHALKLCQGRSIVYIDGDMFVRKYPKIFDMENIDFMSRGWNVDPRASWRFTEAIHYNPYKFETSGGIMYFSSTKESKRLIDLWVEVSARPENSGKADDRILSMIFNMKKYLLNMTVIQLPIEYLWLTLDYDDRLLEHSYDWDYQDMFDHIYIDHPECLTSEESAEGAGAASDRTPKLHRFLDATEDDEPVTERMYEFLSFPSKEFAHQFRAYHKYLENATYINDGNPFLIENGMVDPEDSSNNLRPLYVTPYDAENFYGDRQETYLENTKRLNDVSSWLATNKTGENMQMNRANNDTTIIVYEEQLVGHFDISKETSAIQSGYILPLIWTLLQESNVIFISSKAAAKNNDSYLNYMNSKRDNMNLMFVPKISEMYHGMLKPIIDFDHPVYFSATDTSDFLRKAMLLFSSLDDLSKSLYKGQYHIISRIRIEYIMKSKKNRDPRGTMKSIIKNPRKLQDQSRQMQSLSYSPSVFSSQERNSPVEEYKDSTGSQFGGKDKVISEEELMEYMSGQEDMYGEYGIADNDESSLTPKGGKRKKKSKKNKKTKRSRKTRGAKRGRHVNRSRKTRKGKRQVKKRYTRRGTR